MQLSFSVYSFLIKFTTIFTIKMEFINSIFIFILQFFKILKSNLLMIGKLSKNKLLVEILNADITYSYFSPLK